MGIAIGLALSITIVAFVVWPLLRPARSRPARSDSRARELREQKAEIYRQIRQAEHDRAAGLIEQADLEAQVADLRVRAAQVIKEETELTSEEARLEAEIARARATIRKQGRSGVEGSGEAPRGNKE